MYCPAVLCKGEFCRGFKLLLEVISVSFANDFGILKLYPAMDIVFPINIIAPKRTGTENIGSYFLYFIFFYTYKVHESCYITLNICIMK